MTVQELIDELQKVGEYIYTHRALSFPTKEMAEEFLECFKDLCETAEILL